MYARTPQAFKDAGQAHLLDNLSKSLGHGMGIEFKEHNSTLFTKHDESNRCVCVCVCVCVCLCV